MRDLLVILLVFGSLPLIFQRPFTGILVWTWLGLMSPHRLTWGIAYELPLAQIILITFAISYLFSKESKTIPGSRELFVLAIFVFWMFITTNFAIVPDAAWEQFIKVCKIQIGIVLTLMLTNTKERVIALVWTAGLSICFYGVKGGLYVLRTGGTHQVFGPPGSFIAGNNELGLAMVMIVPVLWFLVGRCDQRWLRNLMYVAFGLTLLSIIGTHSRGALVGIVAMGGMMILKSKRKILPFFIATVFILLVPLIMPAHWFERMNTIATYEQDSSAMRRIESWGIAVDIAQDRILGGGFEAVAYTAPQDAHSIYFEVLGEHGFIGLALFLLLGALTWRKAAHIKRLAKQREEFAWAGDLASMLQVTIIGYGACGAFLGLAYFDLIYIIVAMVVVTHRILIGEMNQERTSRHSVGTRGVARASAAVGSGA